MHWQFGEMEFGEMKRNPSNWSNFCMLLRRAGLTASAGLSCCFTLFRDWFKQHTDMRIGSLFELSQPSGRLKEWRQYSHVIICAACVTANYENVSMFTCLYYMYAWRICLRLIGWRHY